MIPIKLHIKNFMAYREIEPLDFSEFHIACLSGENGAGKSSILDAITWTLWGKARVRSDDDLIHLGEVEMETEFIFDLAGEVYRVLRRRSSSNRGRSELHFHMSEAGGWRTLTETSIRRTQEKIDRLLRLDYNTFINSAFLLQGRADEFTAKRPSERKQILGDILGLGIYDEYAERAKTYVRRYRDEIRTLEGQIQEIENVIAQEPEYRAQLNESQQKVAVLNKDLRQAENTLNQYLQEAKALSFKRNMLSDLQERLKTAQDDIQELETSIARVSKRVAEYEAICAQKTDIEAGYQQYQKALEEVETWNQRLAQSSTLSAEKHRLENQITQARHQLETELKMAESRQTELSQKTAQLPDLTKKLAALETQLAALQTLEETREEHRQTISGLETEAARLEQQNDQLKGEMTVIKERLLQLEAASSTCPVCTQPLTETHRSTVKAQFETDGTTKGDTYRANKTRLQAIQGELKTVQTSISQADRDLRQHRPLQSQFATTEKTLQEAQAAESQLPDLEAKIKTLHQTLDEGKIDPEAQTALTKVETELSQLGYDAAAHEQARQTGKDLAHFAGELTTLQQAEANFPEESARLKAEQDRLERLLKQTEGDRGQIETLRAETAAYAELEAAMQEADVLVNRLQQDLRQADQAQSAAQQMLNYIAQRAKERGDLEETLQEQREKQAIYETLVTAFGKRGVQALLIEHAIPELEDGANEILSRMTDGRMHLQFITQKTTKTSENVVETLDIRIADEVGTRDYDLYSGGEAFRVNFAIRIALSKLLARRSGARLQTLVIDEGFGSQDAQGRERLVEAINKIQDEFEKIIVITHIEELKDAFPKRITIYKTMEGSKISLN